MTKIFGPSDIVTTILKRYSKGERIAQMVEYLGATAVGMAGFCNNRQTHYLINIPFNIKSDPADGPSTQHTRTHRLARYIHIHSQGSQTKLHSLHIYTKYADSAGMSRGCRTHKIWTETIVL